MTTTDGAPRTRSEQVTPGGRMHLLFNHPLSSYYLLTAATLLLLVLGLVMVLSASSILSFQTMGSSYTLAERQLLFAVIGVVLMFLSARTSPHFWKGIAPALVGFAFIGLLAVLVIGVTVNGQKNWIDLVGPLRFQPSEFAKIALVIWGADHLSRNRREVYSWKTLLIPVLPVALAMMVLILMEGDFGNTFLIALILMGMLFAMGVPRKFFYVSGGLMLFTTWVMTLIAPYRMSRFTSWLHPGSDPLGIGWQVSQGQLALGTGGCLGVGIGASREKWGSLPEAHTDFIYSVIGEELGLVGTLTVLVLLAALAFAIFRLARNSKDPFVRLATVGVGVWLTAQGLWNVGSVLGLLPITGVALPLVSYGGSSLVPTLVAIGMLLSFARQEPAARSALRRKQTARSLRRR